MNRASEIKVSYKSRINLSEAPQITSSREAFKVFTAHWDWSEIELREHFNILLLNRSGRVKAFYNVSIGGLSGTVVDAKIIFSVALKTMSSSVILAHNHPSGNLNPSFADKNLTTKLVEAGKTLDLPVLDHLILTPEGRYYSFADEGLI